MEKPGTWGNHLTLVALSNTLNLKIVILSSAGDDNNCIMEILPLHQKKETKTIYLSHIAEFHYSSIVPKPKEKRKLVGIRKVEDEISQNKKLRKL